jgi:hypothetical protein
MTSDLTKPLKSTLATFFYSKLPKSALYDLGLIYEIITNKRGIIEIMKETESYLNDIESRYFLYRAERREELEKNYVVYDFAELLEDFEDVKHVGQFVNAKRTKDGVTGTLRYDVGLGLYYAFIPKTFIIEESDGE